MSINVGSKRKSVLLMAVIMLFVMMLSLLSVQVVWADPTDIGTYSSEVYSEMQSNYSNVYYQTSGGGQYSYADLLKMDGTVYKINEITYGQLTSKAQTEFISNLDACATAVVQRSIANNSYDYSYETQTNWYQILQQQNGVGTKFMNVILQNTKPDFVAANKIYQPFSGIIGTILGLIAVLIMGFLGIVMVADIAYITLPPVRLFVSDGEKGEGTPASKIFSHDALYAVKQAEQNDKGNGTPKQALGIYFKRRVIMLILLGICLMYLVQGQIYSLVGYILDLVSGFMG